MASSKKPTYRARHIDMQHFALQEWVELKQVILEHIRTHLDLDDNSTNYIGWVLHIRHTRIIMGEYESTCMHI